jgi:hypothetical protein
MGASPDVRADDLFEGAVVVIHEGAVDVKSRLAVLTLGCVGGGVIREIAWS